MKKNVLLLAILCFSMYTIGMAQTQAKFDHFEQRLDEYVTALSGVGIFSGQVLVSHQNRIIFQKGYGWASRRFQIPHEPNTHYRAGSVTKSFTAIAILQLYDQGLLNLEDKLSKYLPDFPFGDRIQLYPTFSAPF